MIIKLSAIFKILDEKDETVGLAEASVSFEVSEKEISTAIQ